MNELTCTKLEVDAICCDIGDVLFYDFPIKLVYSYQMYTSICRYYSDSPGPWELWHCGGRQVDRLSRIDPDLWATANSQAWTTVIDRWDNLFHQIPGAYASLNCLSTIPIALVANQPKHIVPILEELGFTAITQHIVLDALCGHAKPNPAIFLEAIERLKCPSYRCVMIGDDIDNDVIPARQLGMQSIWIEPYPYNDEIVVHDVPDRWAAIFRNGRALQIQRQRQRLAGLAPSLRPDVCSASLSEVCGRFV